MMSRENPRKRGHEGKHPAGCPACITEAERQRRPWHRDYQEILAHKSDEFRARHDKAVARRGKATAYVMCPQCEASFQVQPGEKAIPPHSQRSSATGWEPAPCPGSGLDEDGQPIRENPPPDRVQTIAFKMLQRYGSIEKAADMAHEHAMDHERGSREREFWDAVRTAIKGGSMKRNPKGRPGAPKTVALDDTVLNTWFERDRAHVELRNAHTYETILEFWDEAVAEAVEDGFLDPRDWHGSIYDYAVHLGLIKERR